MRRAIALVAAASALLSNPAWAQQPIHLQAKDTSAAGLRSDPAFSVADQPVTGQYIHLSVGHVIFLDAAARIRRIYVASPTVLDSYTVNPHQVVLTAKLPGLSSVVLWDENGKQEIYTVSVDIDIADLRASIQKAMPNETIGVEASQDKVLLTGTVGTVGLSDAAARLAGLFAKDVVNSLVVNSAHVKQVRLKVRIVEVDRSRLTQFGINFFSPGSGSILASASTSQFPTTATLPSGSSSVIASALTVSDPLNFLLYSAKAELGVTIKDLENKQILQILAEPTITTLSGQKASFLSGGEFPFPVVQGGAGGLTSISIEFRPYGVKLEFTPEVNVDGTIALKIAPEVSALDYTNAVTISGYTIPALSTRHAETQVVLRSGQSFAISGLLDKRTTDALNRTPGISSVPILGALFKSKGVNLSTVELMVIVTPTVVDPLTDTSIPDEPAQTRPFLKPGDVQKGIPTSVEKK